MSLNKRAGNLSTWEFNPSLRDERVRKELSLAEVIGMLPTAETAEIEIVQDYLVGWEADENE